jgi:hypothetical protein
MAKSQYKFDYMAETCQLAGIPLPCENLKQFEEELRYDNPSLYRKINRFCWLRETGQQFKRVPMSQGTRVKSVDKEIKRLQFNK